MAKALMKLLKAPTDRGVFDWLGDMEGRFE
ncbi:hypothetical protein SAMN05216409_109272 [Pseudomonas lutea]|uniref:Uncharacterized protein n=1 Tax=Pseudomonas lutea TaxID=243924 RepID=A0A9X8MEJ2_9PSED|nr:hypothetical protein SAMN05216409_109272 [Pseudomonas lutea]